MSTSWRERNKKTSCGGNVEESANFRKFLVGRGAAQFECAACGTLVAQPRQDASATGTFPAESNADTSDFPDLFTAVQRQLRLKVNKAEDVPTEVIEIGKLDKVPVEN